jgi:hypothetical protein
MMDGWKKAASACDLAFLAASAGSNNLSDLEEPKVYSTLLQSCRRTDEGCTQTNYL